MQNIQTTENCFVVFIWYKAVQSQEAPLQLEIFIYKKGKSKFSFFSKFVSSFVDIRLSFDWWASIFNTKLTLPTSTHFHEGYESFGTFYSKQSQVIHLSHFQ